jgi:iron(II)-dependent oxidoreductase
MSLELTAPRTWKSRLFGRRPAAAPAPVVKPATAPNHGATIADAARRLIGDDRYVFLLLQEAAEELRSPEVEPAWKALDTRMALVPGGVVPITRDDGTAGTAPVGAFYLDREPITNRQFQRFVAAGGYDALEFWPQEIWPGLMRFVDHSGQPGPSGWSNGQFPAGKADHPAVGVCWYEALAYARWVGKRLPTAHEWLKAGGWPQQLSGGRCNRYPWGDVFDPTRANLSSAGLGDTVPVRSFATGSTPNGIHQMTGNVWEWLDDPLEAIPCRQGEIFQPWKPMRRIAGGAFDTYLPGEATCSFVTGQPEQDRRENIGFRCALAVERLRERSDCS